MRDKEEIRQELLASAIEADKKRPKLTESEIRERVARSHEQSPRRVIYPMTINH